MNQNHFTLSFPLKLPADAKALAEQLPPLMPGRRTRWRGRLGQRVRSGRQTHRQYLAGYLSGDEHQRGWLRRNCAGGVFSAKWLWPLRYDRKRLGMDQRLVPVGSPKSSDQQSHRARTRQPSYCARANAEPCHQRRLVFVLHELLFSLSPGRTAAPGERPFGRPSGLSHGAQ
jgi:hypothetical protein